MKNLIITLITLISVNSYVWAGNSCETLEERASCEGMVLSPFTPMCAAMSGRGWQ